MWAAEAAADLFYMIHLPQKPGNDLLLSTIQHTHKNTVHCVFVPIQFEDVASQ